MSGDKWLDDHRFTQSRGLNVEDTVNRAGRTVDVAAVLRTLSPGEIDYATELFKLWAELKQHQGIRGAGKAMLLLLDVELARRELERAKVLAEFDMLTAELRPEPLPTGPTDDLPRWSEVSSEKP